jgi:hypothetical protein
MLQFAGMINLGVAITEDKRNDSNGDMFLERAMAFSKQTVSEFL